LAGVGSFVATGGDLGASLETTRLASNVSNEISNGLEAKSKNEAIEGALSKTSKDLSAFLGENFPIYLQITNIKKSEKGDKIILTANAMSVTGIEEQNIVDVLKMIQSDQIAADGEESVLAKATVLSVDANTNQLQLEVGKKEASSVQTAYDEGKLIARAGKIKKTLKGKIPFIKKN
jgi:hypothetical protein